MIYATFSKPNDEVVFTKYAFAMYSIYAKHFRCKVKKYDDKEFQFKLENLSKIIISDITGKEIYNDKNIYLPFKINTSNLKSGTYIVSYFDINNNYYHNKITIN